MKILQVSLKRRIFIFCSLLILLSISTYIFITYQFINSMRTKINDNYSRTLYEASNSLEDVIWQLTLTSEQLSQSNDIKSNFLDYISSANIIDKNNYYVNLRNTINLLTMANEDIGLIYIYDTKDDKVVFSSFPLSENLTVRTDNDYLYRGDELSFIAPRQSQSHFINRPVIILNRRLKLDSEDRYMISIESGFYSISKILGKAYSSFDDIYFRSSDQSKNNIQNNTNIKYTYTHAANQGWSIYGTISYDTYNKELSSITINFLISSILLLIIVSIVGIVFFKSTYKPLTLVEKQLNSFLSDDMQSGELQTNIPEYQNLFVRIKSLQKEVNYLLNKTKEEEKINYTIQLEKLRSQINPHFIMNTLNTLHWLALINDEPEIDNITQSLSHLLSYNLDKDNISTTLNKELITITYYADLQKVRYNFSLNITKEPDDDLLNYACPKFILQPIIENSILHGYKDNMQINIHVVVHDHITIHINDNGTGIDADTLNKLIILYNSKQYCNRPYIDLKDEQSDEHFGIGLSYIFQSLDDFYSGHYCFNISSEYGEKTHIEITIPQMKGDYDDQSFNRR
ncbi:MAG: histidine kinase [Hungatella sp.]|nr:histidine kinase [Hungatella sp.]